MPPNAGMSVSWVHAGVDNIIGRNYSNDPMPYDYNWSQDAFIIGFSLKFTNWLSAGISGKVLSDKLVNSSSSGFSADIGMKVNPLKDLTFGLVIKDVSGKTTWDTSAEPYAEYQTRRVDYYPTTLNIGVSYIIKERLLLTADYKYSEMIEPTWHAGIEARIGEILVLRTGLNNANPAFGLGTSFELWKKVSTRMNYAFLAGMLQEGNSHLFTWLFYF
jgi:hypothetical protein